jgi:transposase
MLADEVDYVLGVDTHRDEHVVAVVAAPAGAVVAGKTARANARGYRELLRLAEGHAPGRRAWAIEGTGSYGAGLARYLAEHGETVLEVSRIPRTERRLRGKDDALDAARTARAALAADALTLPRSGERREALRLLLVARRSAVDVRREALTQLRAVIVTAPEELRQQLRRLSTGKLLDRCSRLRRSNASADELATRLVLRSLARRVQAATLEADQLERELLGHVRALAPGLLDEPGVGPVVAAQLIVAWSHHGRLRSEACFARLAGVAPVPASSGQTRRHRLSRGGDRQLNRAIHTIVLHRRQHDAATKDYIARRIADGKSKRDATICGYAHPRPVLEDVYRLAGRRTLELHRRHDVGLRHLKPKEARAVLGLEPCLRGGWVGVHTNPDVGVVPRAEAVHLDPLRRQGGKVYRLLQREQLAERVGGVIVDLVHAGSDRF